MELHMVTYGVSSAVFLVMNKSVTTHYRDHVMILALQQSIVVVCYVLGCQLPSLRLLFLGKSTKRGYVWPFDMVTLKAVLPMTAAFLAMIWLNSVCLSYASVGSYMVAKACCLTFNVALAKVFIAEYKVNSMCIMGCLLMTGSILVAARSLQCNTLGLIAGLISSFAQATFMLLNSIITKNSHSKSAIAMMGHYTLLSVIALWLFIAFRPVVITKLPSPKIVTHIVITGLINMVVASSAVLSLKQSNPVTVNVIGYVKSVLQVAIAVVCLHERLNMREFIGIVMTLAGGSLYSYGGAKKAKVIRVVK